MSDVDLDAWIDGTCGLTKTARIYQRGDLFAELDKLERQLEVAKSIPKADRGMVDASPQQIQQQIEQTVNLLHESSMIVHIQDRTEARRRSITERLKKQGLDPEKTEDMDTIGLHIMADAIVKVETPDGKVKNLPDGFPVEKLRALRDRLGDAALYEASKTLHQVTQEAPSVSAPLSRSSSYGRSTRT